jgi:D-alanyl-lipoteichoic acid acyltransferase DltB (MBOAT superfamily)
MIKKNIRARGNMERPFEDYSTKDFDISWRMQMLSDHIKSGL